MLFFKCCAVLSATPRTSVMVHLWHWTSHSRDKVNREADSFTGNIKGIHLLLFIKVSIKITGTQRHRPPTTSCLFPPLCPPPSRPLPSLKYMTIREEDLPKSNREHNSCHGFSDTCRTVCCVCKHGTVKLTAWESSPKGLLARCSTDRGKAIRWQAATSETWEQRRQWWKPQAKPHWAALLPDHQSVIRTAYTPGCTPQRMCVRIAWLCCVCSMSVSYDVSVLPLCFFLPPSPPALTPCHLTAFPTHQVLKGNFLTPHLTNKYSLETDAAAQTDDAGPFHSLYTVHQTVPLLCQNPRWPGLSPSLPPACKHRALDVSVTSGSLTVWRTLFRFFFFFRTCVCGYKCDCIDIWKTFTNKKKSNLIPDHPAFQLCHQGRN